MERRQLLESWLKAYFSGKNFTLKAASTDASFRSYFRVFIGDQTWIVMDAPPQQEDCRPFIQVTEMLAATGVHVPKIYAQDLEHGFLLLSDLGETTYLQRLNQHQDQANQLYSNATDVLIKMQLSPQATSLPPYDEALLRRELSLFPDWYVAKHLQVELTEQQKISLENSFSLIVQNNLAQPRAFVHRDYHSRNLMVSVPDPGVIDFQDAVYGPITYDLVSLFKDAYIRWDEERVLDWTIRYWEKARQASLPVATDFSDFYRDFEWMGVQRHLKVLGVFARLNYRDGKPNYLGDMPMVVEYLQKTCDRYRELSPLLDLLDELHRVTPDSKIGYSF